MKSPRAIVHRAAPAIAACMLLPPWTAAVRAGEQVSPHSETKLLPADGSEGDHFGVSVAISAHTAVIAAVGDDALGTDSGSAYIFERDPLDPAVWTQTAKLTADDGSRLQSFGTAVGISGDTAVIGAYRDNDLGAFAGAAYVFERDPPDPAVWTQTAKLTAADGSRYDQFGLAVAISGDTAVIGAWQDEELGVYTGSAYVFERDRLDPSVWTQSAKLTAADGASGDAFGISVAIYGNTAVIGAYRDDAGGSQSGSAYVFARDPLDPAVWTQTAKLIAADGATEDNFGVSVALYERTAVIGASWDDDLGGTSGSAYVFERDPLDPAAWSQTAKLTAADGGGGNQFGGSVAISGDTAVIGAYFDNDLGQGSGSAYVFERDPFDAAVWTQAAKITASDGAAYDHFGESVAISGDAAVIGARYDNDLGPDAGSAYVYAPLVCELELAVEPRALRAGEELRVAVDLHHRRPITVTVPFLLWVEDAAGHVVVEKSSRPVTMEPGDRLQVRLAVNLPPSMPPGAYRLVVGVQRMQQGIAWASREFYVVE